MLDDGNERHVRFQPAVMRLANDGESWFISVTDLLGNISMLRTEIEAVGSGDVIQSVLNALDAITHMIVSAIEVAEED